MIKPEQLAERERVCCGSSFPRGASLVLCWGISPAETSLVLETGPVQCSGRTEADSRVEHVRHGDGALGQRREDHALERFRDCVHQRPSGAAAVVEVFLMARGVPLLKSAVYRSRAEYLVPVNIEKDRVSLCRGELGFLV